MPVLISMKRADVENMNNHVLDDGEPAYTRYRVMDSGPQRGDEIPDYYFRVGDGTTSGGTVPGASTIGIGLQFAISSVGNCMRKIEDLSGGYWTPWVSQDFLSPYAKDYLSSTEISCLTPDVWQSTPNVHLGYGTLYFDGTRVEFCHTGNSPYRFENHRYGATNSSSITYLTSALFWGRIHNTVDIQSGYMREGFAVRNVAVLEKDSTTCERFRLVSTESVVSNDRTSTQIDAACFRSGIIPDPDSYIENIGRFKNWYGFTCNNLNSTLWLEENPSSTAYVRNFFGYHISSQDATCFDGHVYGLFAEYLDSGPTVDGAAADNPETSGWDTTNSGITRFCNVNWLGLTATKAYAFTARCVGTDAYDSTSVGADYAQGLGIGYIGNSTNTLTAFGARIGWLYSSDVGVGFSVGSVRVTSSNASSFAAGVWVQNVERYGLDSDNAVSYGYVQMPNTASQFGSLSSTVGICNHSCFAALDINPDSTTSGSDVTITGLKLYNFGYSNGHSVYGCNFDNIGNYTDATSVYGIYGHNLISRNGFLAGVYFEQLTNIGTSDQDDLYGLAAHDLMTDGNLYGVSVSGFRSESDGATNTRGISVTDGTSLSTIEGMVVSGMYSLSDSKGVYVSGIDSTSSTAHGMKIYNVGNYNSCTHAYGIEIDGVKSPTGICGIKLQNIGYGALSGDADGIYMYRLGHSGTSSSATNAIRLVSAKGNIVRGLYISDATSTNGELMGMHLSSLACNQDIYAIRVATASATSGNDIFGMHMSTLTSTNNIYLNYLTLATATNNIFGLYMNGSDLTATSGNIYTIYVAGDVITNVHMRLPESGSAIGDWYVDVNGFIKQKLS